MAKRNKQKGFTLVELSIVLVIIGLIVSGVLVGQDLIKAAELRATARQVQEFQSAVNTFIGKYSGVPGDIDANKYGLCDGDGNAADGSPMTCNVIAVDAATTGCDGESGRGDGDGLIEDDAGGRTVHQGEVACFWANLTTPGKELISGVYDGFSTNAGTNGAANDGIGLNVPKMKFGAHGWGVYTDGSGNFLTTGLIGSGAADAYATAVDFVPLDAFNIDEKVDDGVPTAGYVQSRGAHTSDPETEATTNAGVSATVCNNTTANPDEYQFTATTALCRLRFELQTF